MRNEIIIDKLLGYTNKILKYCNGLDFEGFTANPMLVEACIFNLSQMGELTNKLDATYKDNHKHVPWNQLYGLRNRIVHDYDGVNLLLIWQIIEEDLIPLKESLLKLKP